MSNSSEASQKVPKTFDKKSAILESFENLRKWREEQLQKFRSMQIAENKKHEEKSCGIQNSINEAMEPSKRDSSFTEIAVVESQTSLDSNITSNSTATSHMIRCFNDSSENSLAFSKNEDLSDTPKPMPQMTKKPFLRKRSGLQRYLPKSAHQRKHSENIISSEQQERVPHIPKIKNFHSNKSSSTSVSTSVKHVYFKETERNDDSEKISNSKASDPLIFNKHLNDDESLEEHKPQKTFQITEDSDLNIDEVKNLKKSVEKSMMNQEIENNELAKFELLEKCAQNSSFNSDCSVVKRFLHEDPDSPPLSNEAESSPIKLQKQIKSKNFDSAESPSSKKSLSEYLQEAMKKKKNIEYLICETNPRIFKLQKEISVPQNELLISNINFMTTERCSTPIDPSSVSVVTNSDSVETTKKFLYAECIPSKDEITPLESKEKESIVDQMLIAGSSSIDIPNTLEDATEKQKALIREKIFELEQEIEIYKSQNARLADICKEREEIARKLKKEYDGVEKFKQEQRKKLETEIENERKQLKRERETFTRFQKLQKENYSRREREEITALRLENEKLKEELKRQKNKFTNDMRRMKNQLANAEKEADTSKLKIITLEEQIEDLLGVLKAKNFKTKKSSLLACKKSKEEQLPTSECDTLQKEDIVNNNKDKSLENSSVEFNNKINLQEKENGTDVPNMRPRVRFNLIPQFHASVEDLTPQEIESFDSGDIDTELSRKSPPDNSECLQSENTNLTELNEPVFDQLKLGNKIEKLHPSGGKEIIFPSGTRKIIAADEKTVKIFFYNGDIKNIFPDGREIYHYGNGVIEKSLPCGIKITEFPNGQMERQFFDGSKEVTFSDGTIHYFYPDGSEMIVGRDGMKATIEADGTEIIETVNGDREIRTADFKKREFPDGSVRIIFASGRQETRYSNGRVRIKDRDGRIIMDTKRLKNLKIDS